MTTWLIAKVPALIAYVASAGLAISATTGSAGDGVEINGKSTITITLAIALIASVWKMSSLITLLKKSVEDGEERDDAQDLRHNELKASIEKDTAQIIEKLAVLEKDYWIRQHQTKQNQPPVTPKD